jgi:hypothetical protein
MAKVQEIKVINVDDVPYVVEALSSEIQSQVSQYNEWRQEHENARLEVVKIEFALQVLGQQILNSIRAEKEKAEAAAAAAEPVESVEPATIG